MGFRKLSQAVRATICGSADVCTGALEATLTVAWICRIMGEGWDIGAR
jgi:hypothetical protein